MLQGANHTHKKPVTLLDHVMYMVALIAPLFTIPQFLDVWINKDASGLSLFTWSAYSIFTFLWMLYWKEHNKIWILFGHIIIFILNVGIVVGILLYS